MWRERGEGKPQTSCRGLVCVVLNSLIIYEQALLHVIIFQLSFNVFLIVHFFVLFWVFVTAIPPPWSSLTDRLELRSAFSYELIFLSATQVIVVWKRIRASSVSLHVSDRVTFKSTYFQSNSLMCLLSCHLNEVTHMPRLTVCPAKPQQRGRDHVLHRITLQSDRNVE